MKDWELKFYAWKKKGLIFNVCRPLREAVAEHKEHHEEHAPYEPEDPAVAEAKRLELE